MLDENLVETEMGKLKGNEYKKKEQMENSF